MRIGTPGHAHHLPQPGQYFPYQLLVLGRQRQAILTKRRPVAHAGRQCRQVRRGLIRLLRRSGILAAGLFARSRSVIGAGGLGLPGLAGQLLRPGRFDRKVYIPLPGVRAREEILETHLAKLKKTISLDRRRLAEMGAGMSGADLANWVNEAAIEAARSDAPAVSMDHFALARDRVLVGPRNFGVEMSEEEESDVAWHEAGHAVVRHALGGKVDRVTIIPHGGALGVTFTVPEEKTRFTREGLQTELAVLMAGRAAEELFTGSVSGGAASDIERASRMAYEAVSVMGLSDDALFAPQTEAGRTRAEQEAANLVRAAYTQAKELLEAHRGEAQVLRDRLMTDKVVPDPFGRLGLAVENPFADI